MKHQFFQLLLLLGAVLFSSNLAAQPIVEISEISSGLFRPVSISHAEDDRLFVVNQSGEIKILDGERNLLSPSFLDIRAKVRTSGGEQGLLGLAFHPDYKENGNFYVHYIISNGNSRISRFSVMEQDSNRADVNSEKILMTIVQPYGNHNGGDLKFGPDGYLYIALGDGGSAGDPQRYSQNRQSLLGKMLRIDVNQGDPYAIPINNPFVADASTRDEIWALGLRNPWRFSFDRLTGDIWIGDVGQSDYEEISMQPANSMGGENYGWRCYEGFTPFNNFQCPPSNSLVDPVHAYDNTFSVGESVTGGFVYRGKEYPLLDGHYIFGDYESGRMWTLFREQDETWGLTQQGSPLSVKQISTFGEDANGELYVAAYSSGKIYQIREKCSPFIPEVNEEVGELSTTASGISYQWFLDGEEVVGAITQSLIPELAGSYTVAVNYENGCSVSSKPFDFVLTNTRDRENTYISIYPNPLKDVSYIELPIEEGGEISLFIRDIQGRTVRTMTKITSRTIKIERRNLLQGVYIVEIRGKKVYRGKLVIERE